MASSFTPQEIEEFLQEFFDVVGARQYTGARYIPIFGRAGESTVEWDDTAPYEPLTVVMHDGVSYVSRRYVPAGIEITDTAYWVETYRFNAQVEQYRQEVLTFQTQIDNRVPYPDPQTFPKYGVAGQVLSTLGNGFVKWEDPVIVDSQIAEPLIDAWLDDHPEATTTVQDGSVTDAKLVQSGGILSRVDTLLHALNDPRNMLNYAIYRNGYYYSTSPSQAARYSYFKVAVTAGTTYHILPGFRYLSREGAIIESNISVPYDFTPDFSGDVYVTFDTLVPGWVMTTESTPLVVRPFDTPTLTSSAMKQSKGTARNAPMSQKVTTDYLNALGDTITQTETRLSNMIVAEVGGLKNVTGEVINVNDAEIGTLHVGYVGLDGLPNPSTDAYRYTDPIPVVPGDVYHVSKIRFITFFIDGAVQSAVSIADPTGTNVREFTIPSDINTMIVSFYNSDPVKYVGKGVPGQMFTDDAETEILEIASGATIDILKGKKWWACGDSFTAWTTEEFTPSDYPNVTGITHFKTYPFWIGARTGINVYNFAVSGQTMAMPAIPGTFTNAFVNGLYQQIPADVDYITLKFGINDNNHENMYQPGSEGYIECGTVDDTGINTFCGAYNTVLEWIITNRPFAKIGIIVSNGCSLDKYRQATIALATKWGLPWIDENGESRCPAMIRSSNPDVGSVVKNLRLVQQAADLAQQNTHPNVAAQRYESTFLEAFLRSL